MSVLYRILRGIVLVLSKIFFRVRYVGLENLEAYDGFVLCCNHTSMTDVVFLAVACKRQIYFVGKEELFKNKFLGALFKAVGAIPVNRGTGDSGAIKKSLSVVKSGNILGIFPEGTRKPVGPPAKAKAGAALIASQANAPIVPASIYHEGKIHIFSRVTVRFGESVGPFEQTGNMRREIRNISESVMGKITEMWEMGY